MLLSNIRLFHTRRIDFMDCMTIFGFLLLIIFFSFCHFSYLLVCSFCHALNAR